MLGKQIRNLRKERQLTLKELADLTDLSVGYLSQLERDQVEPSLSSIRKIAASLDVPPYIFMDFEKSSALTLRREEQLVLKKPISAMEYTVLTPLPSKDYVPGSLVLGYTLDPGEEDFESLIVHNNEEIVLVLEGELTVHLSSETIVLREGETTVLQKNTPHRFSNDGEVKMRAVSIMTPPIWSLQNL